MQCYIYSSYRKSCCLWANTFKWIIHYEPQKLEW